MAPDNESQRKREEGKRLRLLRLALGYSKRPKMLRELYGEHDVDSMRDALEKWEDGTNRIPDWYVRDLKEWCGVTYDFIRDNDRRNLPTTLYNAIIQYERKTG